MRYIYYCVLAILCIGLVSACVVEEESVGSVDGQLVHKVFNATFEDSDMTTKTVLDEAVGENGFRGLLWDSGDEIGVARYEGYYQKFTNVIGEPSANGVFDGYIDQTSLYYAIYPFTDSQRHSTSVSVTVPTIQTYRVNSFDRNMAPMVGKGNDGEPLHFMNICGVLVVQLTGTEKIKSIIFETKNGAKVSGVCSVDTDYVEYPLLDTSTATETYVTLDCGEGVQLGGEAVPFHIVLPPGVYEGFTLYIATADGKFMKKETSKTLTIKRSIVTKAASFAFEENMTEVTNLSERGHSNCYVVPEAGIYSFEANIIGNGEFGLIEGAGFHTSNPSISPVSVELLWEDRSGLIKGYGYDPATGKCHLWASEQKGNALLAAKNSDGVILWSWHIWLTDSPDTQIYVKSDERSYTMLDRNLGATRADRGTGEQWKDAVGIVYQWGRKDPIAFDHNLKPLFTGDAYTRQDVLNAISNPTYVTTYSDWSDNMNSSWWRSDKKTIYDPCPVGYRVPPVAVWDEFADSGETFDKGWDFNYDGTNTTYYPSTSVLENHGLAYSLFRETVGDYWAADYRDRLYFYYGSETDNSLFTGTVSSAYGFSVRCMKDDNYESTSLPVVKLSGSSEYTTTSITFGADVSYGGWSEVTDRGFIYSTDPDMSDAQTVSCGSGRGEFSYMLEGLASGDECYVKAYATNSYGTSYSDVRRCRTKYSDDNSLSSEWVANCYMVDPTATSYCFDATVVGNGNIGYVAEENFYPQNPVIIPSSAEILWEDVSGVISDIMLQNGRVYFMTNDIEGNALVAVKDADNRILWSWHIWVTDTPEEHTYVTNEGKTFVVMDRYLGSTSGVIAENGGALYYQWGRKDPFKFNGSGLDVSFRTPFANLSEAVSAPMDYPQGDDWVTDMSTSLWSTTMKTIYDPCPDGWRVPSSEIWSGIRRLQDLDDGGYGVVFGFADTDSFWYPDAPRFTNYGNVDGSYTCDQTEVWTAEYGVSYFLKYNGNYTNIRARNDAYPVRCMKDE